MLNKGQQKIITDKTEELVTEYLSNAEIDWNSKEIGHKHGEAIESHIVENFSKIKGFSEPTASREFGDLYVSHNGIREAVNIKFGYQKHGHPNLCSLNRLICAVTGTNPRYPRKLHETYDSYWILSINVLDRNGNFEIHFYDLFQNLDVVSFDAGPGQVMLNEPRFYNTDYQIINNGGTNMNLLKSKLFNLMEAGHQSKIKNLQQTFDNAKKVLSTQP